MIKTSFKQFKEKALADPKVRVEYDLLKDKYKIIDILISVHKGINGYRPL
ncbi:MAG: hypothetical protein H8D23_14520 [Candidatus Brocadiales bacterium]|nr:hypothetical protein [Candidatus Brocadiales bacterium]